MPNPIELFESSAAGYRQTMVGVKPTQIGDSTPCSDWNVQALVNHTIKLTGFVHGMLLENIQVDPFDVAGPFPAEGPMEAFDTGISKILDHAKKAGVMEKTLTTPFGPMTGGQLVMVPMMDLLIHRWDLASATSQDTNLPGNLLEIALAGSAAEMMEGMRGQNFVKAQVSVPDSGSSQAKLLGIWGRTP